MHWLIYVIASLCHIQPSRAIPHFVSIHLVSSDEKPTFRSLLVTAFLQHMFARSLLAYS